MKHSHVTIHPRPFTRAWRRTWATAWRSFPLSGRAVRSGLHDLARLNRLAPCGLAALLTCGVACGPPKSPATTKPPPPATLSSHPREEDLATIRLTPEAVARLGILLVPMESRAVERTRTYGGDVIVPLDWGAGSSNTVETSSPASSRRSVHALFPALTARELVRVAELQVEADGQVVEAEVALGSAETALRRAEHVLANQAGSVRAVDEANAQVQLARAKFQAARTRRELLGAPVFDAVRRNRWWVRVTVYAGDAPQLRRSRSARVKRLGAPLGEPGQEARPLDFPLSSGTGTGTMDLFYEIEAPSEGAFLAGQKVAVDVPLERPVESLVVPHEAVLHDIHGSAWVYTEKEKHVFTRRRVLVSEVTDGRAVLARGGELGAKVVTAGAAELFGAEFGVGK